MRRQTRVQRNDKRYYNRKELQWLAVVKSPPPPGGVKCRREEIE